MIHMLICFASYARRGRHLLKKWAFDPRARRLGQGLLHLLAGLCLSAAGLADRCLPLSMALVLSCTGWPAVLSALGGLLGYRLFWGAAGDIGCFWLLLSLPCVLLLGDRRISRRQPLLLPALAGLICALSGVVFQLVFFRQVPIPIYLLRILLGAGAAWLFSRLLDRRDPILDWLGTGLLVLALAQIAPFPYFGLGYLAAGFLLSTGAFPGAVLAGLALDLAQITPVPMTAVLALSYLVRFLPRYPRLLAALLPGGVYVAVMALCGVWDLQPLPGLLLGSLLGAFAPVPGKFAHRRGETGVAQVRLEMAAGVLAQTQELLSDTEMPPVDEEALMQRAAERACGSCAYRRSCRDTARLGMLPPVTLHKELLSTDELPILCRKPGRYLAELHRCQEQLRSIEADRQRQREYRMALIQQYRFLASFLQELADRLPRRAEPARLAYQPEVQCFGNRPRPDNGDRFLHFSGVGKKHYVLLCDGMGTGPGAVSEGKAAAGLLHRMLSAGYPAEHALRSLNSLCALRDRAGAVTVDLAELFLDSGKVRLYKWGAAPSYLVSRYGAERIGAVGAPPGLSVTQGQEQTVQLSIRSGEWLVMVSDGVDSRQALRCCVELCDRTPGELAAGLLACTQFPGTVGCAAGEGARRAAAACGDIPLGTPGSFRHTAGRDTSHHPDDATVILFRLRPL